MGNVRNILKAKTRGTITIFPHNTVYEALEIMVENNIGALLVVNDGKLVGIFTERDYARKVILQGKASKDLLIGEIMSDKLITISPDTPLEDCMVLMTTEFIRHLPVIENGELVGIITIGDVVKNIIDEQKFIIEHLEQYIKGR